jgi:uncharacterized protein (TIGR02594 family)
MTEPKWLEIARTDLGIEEIAGPKSNPRIMAFYRAANANWAKDDAVPWCGAAMAGWITSAGFPAPAEAARARAWLDWGVPLQDPKPGAVAILKRGTDEKQGHVTLYLADRGDRIECLGGNQGDAVSITAYPKRDLLGYRWPAGADVPAKVPVTAVVEVKPLYQSRTVRNVTAGGVAATAGFFENASKLSLEWVAAVTALNPVKTALLEMGGNVRAIALGIGVATGVRIVSAYLDDRMKRKGTTDGQPV